MAKNGDIGLANAPKIDAKKNLSDQGFVLVTDGNRKNAIKKGRILYKIDTYSGKNTLVDFFQVYPCLKKGWNNIANFPWDLEHPYVNGKTHWKCYFDKDWNYQEWADSYKYLIDKSINKNLYFNINDPILNTHEVNSR